MRNDWPRGVHYVGRFGCEVGCWVLHHGREAAVLELPPRDGEHPVESVRTVVEQLGLRVKYLLCSHDHEDHFDLLTLLAMAAAFPGAETWLHEEFSIRGRAPRLPRAVDLRFFRRFATLDLGGEPLHLVSSPRNSVTDTFVLFRGMVCTSDWEPSGGGCGELTGVRAALPADQFPELSGYPIRASFSTYVGSDQT